MKFAIFKKNSKWAHALLAAFIFALAFTLRVVGADWGMPRNDLHPDEAFVFEEAYKCALNRTFETRIYFRPNHVSIKLNTILYIGIQEFVFEPQGKGDFAVNFEEHFSLFMTASRILNALIGTGVVVFAYLIARFFDKRKALYAAFLFAVLASFIEHSHYLAPDIPLLFFLMGTLWAALCYSRKPSVGMLFWMSFFTALAVCEKYPGLYGCLIIAVSVIMTHIKKPLLIVRDGFLAIFFLILGITAISPVLIIDFREVYHTMQGQNKTLHLGADGLNFPETLWYYSKTAAVSLGLILTLCCLYGIVRSFKENFKPTLLVFSLLIYILPISSLKIHWERYTLPIYAVGLLFAALGSFYVWEDLKKVTARSKWLETGLLIVLFILPSLSQLTGGIASTSRFLAPDSRIALQPVFAEMGITTDNADHDCNTPLDPSGFYGAFSNYEGCDPGHFKYGQSPKYLVTSSAQRDAVLASKPEMYGGIAKFYNLLDEEYTLVKLFPVRNPEPKFLEAYNIVYNAKTVIDYLKGAMQGFEIRVYALY